MLALLFVDFNAHSACGSLGSLRLWLAQQTGAMATSSSDAVDEQTAVVSAADVTRVVAMLQSTAVPTELGGGSLWQHIDEALKASLEQWQPHVREASLKRTAERNRTVGPLR